MAFKKINKIGEKGEDWAESNKELKIRKECLCQIDKFELNFCQVTV